MDQVRLPDSVSRSITLRCGSIVSLSLVWEAASRKLLQAGVEEADVAFLVAAMRSSRNLESLVSGLVVEGQTVAAFLSDLRGLVNQSEFAIEAWFAAFEVVQARLVRDGRVASPSSILGYIQCSAEFGSGMNSSGGLAVVVLEMLNHYGFEGQEGCATGGDG